MYQRCSVQVTTIMQEVMLAVYSWYFELELQSLYPPVPFVKVLRICIQRYSTKLNYQKFKRFLPES